MTRRRIPIPFIVPSYNKKNFTSASVQRLVNFYQEPYMSAAGSTQMAAIGMPGLNTWINLNGGVIRGMFNYQETGYVVVDNNVYCITNVTSTPPTATLIGTIATSQGMVNFCAIAQNIIVLNDGTNTYSITGAVPPRTLALLSGSGGVLSHITRVVQKDGFFLYLTPTDNVIWVSNLEDPTTVQGTSFFEAPTQADLLQAAITSNEYVYCFGSHSMEIWQDTGAQFQPFTRFAGGIFQFGIAANNSAVSISDNIYFLAQSPNGLLGVIEMNGLTNQVISTNHLNYTFTNYNKVSDAFGWSDVCNGHANYNITFPSAGVVGTTIQGCTWTYDTQTQMWSERTSYNPQFSYNDRHATNCQMYIGGQQIVGDYQSGYLYVLSQSNLSDTLQGVNYPISRTLISPHIMNADYWFALNNLEFDVERGEGLASGQGSSPVMFFSYSKDKGHTWSNQITLNVTAMGQYRNRIRVGSVGSARTLDLKIDCSDPIVWVFYGITAELDSEIKMLQQLGYQ